MIIFSKMAATGDASSRESEEILTASGHGLTPSSAYSAGLHASGYHTPEMTTATQSSSPGSGSFHTANPMDSERSSLADHSEGDEWDGEGREDHSSVEVSSLEGLRTPLASYQGQASVGADTTYLHQDDEEEDEEEAEDTDITLRAHSSPPPAAERAARRGDRRAAHGERGENWINQPKLVLTESDTVPPCPEKRPLNSSLEGSRVTRHPPEEDPAHETTPLLPSSRPRRSEEEEEEEGKCCCAVL